MLCYNCITELLELQDVTVEKIENSEKSKKVYIKLKRKEVNCPCCNTKTSKIHDYRTQNIKDCNTFGKNLILVFSLPQLLTKSRFSINTGMIIFVAIKYWKGVSYLTCGWFTSDNQKTLAYQIGKQVFCIDC